MAHQEGGWELKWELLVADAWNDPALKQRLLNDPASVLNERGIKVPAGIQIKVVENSDSVEHLVLPTKPEEGELSEEELETVAGGHFSGLVIGCGGGGFGGGFGGCRGCGGGGGCRGCGGCGGCGGCRGCGGGGGCRGCRG